MRLVYSQISRTLVAELVRGGGVQKGHSSWNSYVTEWRIHCARGAHDHLPNPHVQHYEEESVSRYGLRCSFGLILSFTDFAFRQLVGMTLETAPVKTPSTPSKAKPPKQYVEMSPGSHTQVREDL
jgi:hypothetical protein